MATATATATATASTAVPAAVSVVVSVAALAVPTVNKSPRVANVWYPVRRSDHALLDGSALASPVRTPIGKSRFLTDSDVWGKDQHLGSQQKPVASGQHMTSRHARAGPAESVVPRVATRLSFEQTSQPTEGLHSAKGTIQLDTYQTAHELSLPAERRYVSVRASHSAPSWATKSPSFVCRAIAAGVAMGWASKSVRRPHP